MRLSMTNCAQGWTSSMVLAAAVPACPYLICAVHTRSCAGDRGSFAPPRIDVNPASLRSLVTVFACPRVVLALKTRTVMVAGSAGRTPTRVSVLAKLPNDVTMDVVVGVVTVD